MLDQAASLRQLVRLAADAPAAQGPMCVAVCGAGPGAGATTVAVQLAGAFVQQGDGAVLLDAGLDGEATRRCDAAGAGHLGDVLAARRALHEILQEHRGIQIAAGAGAPAVDEAGAARLLRQLDGLGAAARWAVVDCGGGESPLARLFWQHASQVVLVATAAATSVMDAYALIKSLGRSDARIGLLINQASPPEAREAFERLAASCQRFLQRPVESWGHLPAVEQPAAADRPDGAAPPDLVIQHLARQLKAGPPQPPA